MFRHAAFFMPFKTYSKRLKQYILYNIKQLYVYIFCIILVGCDKMWFIRCADI